MPPDAADEVGGLVAAVQDESADTAATVREMRAQVSDGVDTVEGALADFEDIVAVVGDVNDSVQEISDATDRQAGTTQDVVARVDDVAAISERTTDSAETAAAAAEQQTASVSTATADVGSPADRAVDLQSLLCQFRLPDGSATDPAVADPGVGGSPSPALTDD